MLLLAWRTATSNGGRWFGCRVMGCVGFGCGVALPNAKRDQQKAHGPLGHGDGGGNPETRDVPVDLPGNLLLFVLVLLFRQVHVE